MAAAKPEVLVSLLPERDVIKIQRLHLHFLGPAFQRSCCKYCRMYVEVGNPVLWYGNKVGRFYEYQQKHPTNVYIYNGNVVVTLSALLG